MEYVSDNVLVVGKDEFTNKDGKTRYSLVLANGNGQPHKVTCPKEYHDIAQPLNKRYTVRINVNTVGYNDYCDLLELIED